MAKEKSCIASTDTGRSVGHGEQNQFTRLNVFCHREGFDTASQIKQDGVPKANLLAI